MKLFNDEATILMRLKGCLILIIIAIGLYTIIRVIEKPRGLPYTIENGNGGGQ